jgi:hypothetical protein
MIDRHEYHDVLLKFPGVHADGRYNICIFDGWVDWKHEFSLLVDPICNFSCLVVLNSKGY